MSLDISEIRPDDHRTVDELLNANQQPEGEANNQVTRTSRQCKSVLSLVARQEGKIIGAILCYDDGERGFIYQLKLADPPQCPDLAKALVDKALRKLIQIQGAHSCRIRLSAETEQGPFWETAKWGSRPELAEQPVASSAVVDRLGSWEPVSPPEYDAESPEPEQASEMESDDASEIERAIAAVDAEGTDASQIDLSQVESDASEIASAIAAADAEGTDASQVDGTDASQVDGTDTPQADQSQMESDDASHIEDAESAEIDASSADMAEDTAESDSAEVVDSVGAETTAQEAASVSEPDRADTAENH